MENEVKFVDCIEFTLTTFVIIEEFQMVRFRTLVTVAVNPYLILGDAEVSGG